MPEPNPKPGREAVAPKLLQSIAEVVAAAKERGGATATSRTATFPALCYLVGQRVEQGKEKYGTVLMAENGRNALMDAWEESIDLCMYLQQAQMEGYPETQFRHVLNRALWTLFDLTRLLMWQDPEFAAKCGYVFPKDCAAKRTAFPDYRREDEP